MTAALASMTGFAHTEGAADGLVWAWELRSVNGRGLDLRLRLPPGWDALEPGLREAAGKRLKRGNVSANLTTTRAAEKKLAPDPAALEQVLALAMALHARIPGSQPPQAEALLALPGVLRPAAEVPEERPATATAAVRLGFDAALTALLEARQAEGERLRAVLDGLLSEIAALHRKAADQAADQPAAHRVRVMENLQALL